MPDPRDPRALPIWDYVSDGLFLTDDRFRILDVNPAGCALLRYTREQLVGRNIADLVVPEELAETPLRGAAISAGERVVSRRTMRTGDGGTRIIEVSASRLPDGCFLGAARDVTEQVTAERHLAESEAGLSRLLDALPDGVVIHSEGRVAYVNQAAMRILGYETVESLVGVPVVELAHPTDRSRVMARVQAMSAGTPAVPPMLERLIRRDGSSVTLEVSAVRSVYQGKPAVVAVGRDTSERRQLEARLAQADRLASVGVLAAGIAHELNNPLTYVLLHLDAIEDTLRTRTMDPLAEHVVHLRRGLDRVRDIVRGVRTFARVGETEAVEADPRKAVELATTMAGHEVRRRATLAVNVPDLPVVRGDVGRLAQVLVNLLVNAAEATPRDGRAHRVEVTGRVEGDRVLLEVADEGPGIDPEVLPRLFEPFFTTKGEAGTGLGLAISQDILAGVGGSIQAANRPEGGARFTISLAKVADQAAPPPPQLTPARIPVLVVDDEAGIRTTLAGLLRDRFEVHGAASVAEALSMLRRGLQVEAILCDLAMPGQTGAEFHAILCQQYPELARRFAIMTGGHTEDRAFRAEMGDRWLEKPATRKELTALLLRLAEPR